MSFLSSIKPACCRVSCNGIDGSGFFLSANLILTAKHNLEDSHSIKGRTLSGAEIEMEVVAADDAVDLAILRVTSGYVSTAMLDLCGFEPVKGVPFEGFGFPATANGKAYGETLCGTVRDFMDTPSLSHDTVLEISGYNVSTSLYKGFSGSPMVDGYGNVIGVYLFSGANSLDSVSIWKAKSFLLANSVAVKDDYLADFKQYGALCFNGFEPDPLGICKLQMQSATMGNGPNEIVKSLAGRIFYPEKKLSVEAVISELKNNVMLNQLLWKGWLELLTYVSMLNAQYPSAGRITVELPTSKVMAVLGIKFKKSPKIIKVKINFFWTEGTPWSTITRQYIHDQFTKGKSVGGGCYIFNSADEGFGRQRPPSGFKKGIVTNIAAPKEASIRIQGDFDFGLLSLGNFTEEVLNCTTLAQTTQKLEQLLLNALEHD